MAHPSGQLMLTKVPQGEGFSLIQFLCRGLVMYKRTGC